MTNAEAWFSVALRPQKPYGSLGRKAQDGHLDFHTTPELWQGLGPGPFCFTSTEARLLIRDGNRGGGGGEEGERVKARPRIPPEKDRRDRGPAPEQWKC